MVSPRRGRKGERAIVCNLIYRSIGMNARTLEVETLSQQRARSECGHKVDGTCKQREGTIPNLLEPFPGEPDPAEKKQSADCQDWQQRIRFPDVYEHLVWIHQVIHRDRIEPGLKLVEKIIFDEQQKNQNKQKEKVCAAK